MTNKMEYILLVKDSNADKSDKSVLQDIKKVFDTTDDASFNVLIKRTEIKIDFTINKRNMDNAEGSAYYLTLIANGKSKQKRIEASEFVHKTITQNVQLRKDYDVTTLYDDVSSYYCIKAYSILHEYEIQIRRLIYKYLIMSLGALWVNKTFGEDLKKQLKERTQGKLVAELLHEMDMSQLESYLFEKKRDKSAESVIDELLSDENIKSMTKEEIMAIVQNARSQSLWDKYFAKHVHIENLQEKMEVIRVNRNKVAHCKPFYSQDYNVAIKILKDDGLIDTLIIAIDKFEMKDRSQSDIIDIVIQDDIQYITIQNVVQGLAEFGEFVKLASIKMSPALIAFGEFVDSIQKSIGYAAIVTAPKLSGTVNNLDYPLNDKKIVLSQIESFFANEITNSLLHMDEYSCENDEKNEDNRQVR